MAEETDRCEEERMEAENPKEVTYTCNGCGKKADAGYFYCPECYWEHRRQKEKDKENNQKQEVR